MPAWDAWEPAPPKKNVRGNILVTRIMYTVASPLSWSHCELLVLPPLTITLSLEVRPHPPRLPPRNLKWAQPLKWTARVGTSHSRPEINTSTKQPQSPAPISPQTSVLSSIKTRKAKRSPTQHIPEGHSPHVLRAHPSQPGPRSHHKTLVSI